MPTEDVPRELLGIPENSDKPAETRLANGASARAIVSKLIKEDETSGYRRAVVDGWVAGNPPYNDGRRRAMGLAWTANINFMGGKALMDSSAVPYYSIFNGVENYAECRSAYDTDHPEFEQRNLDISRRFHNLCRRWKQFDWNIQAASYHMRKHGIGPCFFEKHNDWRFRAIPSGMVLAPRNSPSCVDGRLTHVAIRVRYSVVELWDVIKDEATAKKLGWDVAAVKLAIKRAGQKMLGDNAHNWYMSPWETFQRRLKDDDLSASYTEFNDIACAHLLVQEFNGKITHVVVTESEVIPDDDKANGKKDNDFLFKHANRYDSFDQALVVFFQNMGEGTWHSVRGLADDAFKHGEVENRLLCRMVDGAFIGSSLVIKPGNTQAKDKVQLTQFGAVTVLPPGAEIQQTNLHGALDGPVVVHRIIKNNLGSNIGQFQPRSMSREDGRGEQPTRAQVDFEASKEATLSQGQMSLFYQTLDSLYSEMFRRASDPNTTDAEAKRFQNECKEDGVPAKALQEMEYVRANRASGYGSPQMRQLTDRQMIESGVVSMLPERGRQNFLDDFIGGVKGAEKVRRYNPKEHVPDRDDADAAMENSMIKNGDMPVMISGQNNVVHLQAHLQHAADTLTPLKEAMEAGQSDEGSLQQAFQYVTLMGQHCESHLGEMRADQTRKGLAKMFEEELQNLVAFHGKLRAAIITARREAQQAAREEQQATVLSVLDKAKADSAYADIELKARKTDATIANSAKKTLNQIRLQQIKTAAQVADQRAKAASQKEAA